LPKVQETPKPLGSEQAVLWEFFPTGNVQSQFSLLTPTIFAPLRIQHKTLVTLAFTTLLANVNEIPGGVGDVLSPTDNRY